MSLAIGLAWTSHGSLMAVSPMAHRTPVRFQIKDKLPKETRGNGRGNRPQSSPESSGIHRNPRQYRKGHSRNHGNPW